MLLLGHQSCLAFRQDTQGTAMTLSTGFLSFMQEKEPGLSVGNTTRRNAGV